MRGIGLWIIGVGAAAAAAMAAAPGIPDHAPGIYLEKLDAAGRVDPGGNGPVEKLEAAAATRAGAKDLGKTIVGGMLTGGLLGKPKMVMVYAGPRAKSRVPAQPMFQFQFDPRAAEAPAHAAGDLSAAFAMTGQPGAEMPAGAQAPQDFALVKLRAKGDEREMVVSMDMKPKDTVACRVRQLGPHVFRVAPEQPLAPGEYGFVAVPKGGASGTGPQIWEFGVDAASPSAASAN